MASSAPVLACIFISLLGLSATGLVGLHLLPPWMLAPIFGLQLQRHSPNAEGADLSGPEGPLLQRLKSIDAEREPETAQSLHAAIANILRASGAESKRALSHFEAARDAAVRHGDPDVLLSSYLELADAYIEEGRALDAQHELAVASGVLANHFIEHRAKLNRGRGRAKFELGFTESALSYFEEAVQTAVQPEDKVRAACDVAMAKTCLEQAGASVQQLKQTLELLIADRKKGPEAAMPSALHNTLAAEVHFRLAEAFHSIKNSAFAKAHYSKALHLQQTSPSSKPQRIAAIKSGIKRLDLGIAPELRCQIRRAPWDKPKGAPQNVKDATFLAKINLLLEEQKFDLVEKELKAILNTQSRPYKGLEAATALNMLGSLYRNQRNFAKAAKQYRQSSHAAIVCCGAANPEALEAYEGLRDIKAELSEHEQKVADAVISRYFDVLNKPSKNKSPKVQDENDETSSLQTGSPATAFV